MASDWVEVPVEDLCERVTSGGTPRRQVDGYYNLPGHGTPWVKTKELTDGWLDDTEEWISDRAIAESSAKILPAGTVLLAMYGATVGKLALLRRAMTCNQANCAMVVDSSRADNRFLFYSLLANREKLVGLANGAAQQNLSGQIVKKFSILAPPLDEQRRIAEVLGALDDLIDANETSVAALVALADERFRKVNLIGSSRIFADVVDVFGGGTPSTSAAAFWGGNVPWATPTDLTALKSPYLFGTAKKITESGLRACSSRLHPMGSILMTSRATIGRIAIAQVPAATNQGFIVLQPREEMDRVFLFHELRARVDEFISRANGSTFLEISRGTFKALPVLWPSDEARAALHKTLAPLHDAAVELDRENSTLRRTRDELLPLLMSGAVRVRAA